MEPDTGQRILTQDSSILLLINVHDPRKHIEATPKAIAVFLVSKFMYVLIFCSRLAANIIHLRVVNNGNVDCGSKMDFDHLQLKTSRMSAFGTIADITPVRDHIAYR